MTKTSPQRLPKPGNAQDALQCLKPLEAWRVADKTLPSGVSLEAVKVAREALVELNRPATTQELLVVLDELFSFIDTFCSEMDSDQIKRATKFYLKALDGMPSDLAKLAVDRVCSDYKYGLPKPADIRDAVMVDWVRRQNFELLADRALRFGQ